MRLLRALLAFIPLLSFNTASHATSIVHALQDGPFGLHSSEGLKLTTGQCTDCATIPQALWYFGDETILAPTQGAAAAGYTRDEAVQQDVAHFMATAPSLNTQAPLIWIGSPSVIARTRLSPEGKSILVEDLGEIGFALAPKIETNLSYYDASSRRYLAQRALRLRGELRHTAEGRPEFVARTIWPLDFAIRPDAQLQSLRNEESLRSLVQSSKADAPFSHRLLWEKTPGAARDWGNNAVLGILLNGAQGDDDEAHGGHFAIATGRFREDGDWSRWMVYNFYNLSSHSEKGIIAAPTPMDKYMADLNNGQSWYRPSYMLVAVLKNERTALRYQAGIERVYNRFYRHDFEYGHSAANCAGVSVDTLRTLGWNVPPRGHEPLYKSIGAYAYVAGTSLSLSEGRNIYDYLLEESTRLYPAVAFDALGEDLLNIVQGKTGRSLSEYEKALAEDVVALYYVFVPQIPSSRAFGNAPVYSFDEYMARVPEDRSEWKIIPVTPRPFPDEMRDGLALKPKKSAPVPGPVAAVALFVVAGLGGSVFAWRRRKAS